MPNRIIKESICESSGLADCSVFAQDLYKRLITYADDYGRFNADTQIMLARMYPRELDCVSQQDIIDALTELDGVGKISFYTSQPRKTVYGCFPRWKEHQRVRDSKAKCPDPDDTSVNDWYLQRFIPMDLKVEIIERDGFKCQICNRFITSDKNARRLVKHGSGLYHIDHIVPVQQGGRATADNLRLICPSCNLSRKKMFTFSEIVAFAAKCGEPPRVAANRCELPPESKSNPNPNPNPNPSKAYGIPPQEETGFCGELQEALEMWLAYKAEKRQQYKPIGLQNLVGEIRNNAEKYGSEKVAALIKQCMAANYQGIIFERLEKGSGGKKHATAAEHDRTAPDPMAMRAIQRMMEGDT